MAEAKYNGVRALSNLTAIPEEEREQYRKSSPQDILNRQVEKHKETGQNLENIESIQILLRSRLKIQLFLTLLNGDKTLSQFREITSSSSQALIPIIRKLEAGGYIASAGHIYYLTPFGKVLVQKILDIILFNSVSIKFEKFWEAHFLEAIPNEFLHLLKEINCSKIVTNTSLDIFEVYHQFLKTLKEAAWVNILSPNLSMAYTEAVAIQAREGVPIEITIGKDLADQFSRTHYMDKIREIAGNSNVKIFVFDPIPKLELTVTDKCISLGLFKSDGENFDMTTDLLSKDWRAVCWGQKLYYYYRNQALELNSENCGQQFPTSQAKGDLMTIIF